VEIVTSLVRGSTAAPDSAQGFADWVQPHLGPMARLAARLAPTADRDDIVQEALTRAWRKRHLFDPARGTASASSTSRFPGSR
jgi:RNA polymerase sigma-70 factor (ECF subfamily)